MNIQTRETEIVGLFFGRSHGAGNSVTSNQSGGPTNEFFNHGKACHGFFYSSSAQVNNSTPASNHRVRL